MRRIILAIVLVALNATTFAQPPTPVVCWNHSGAGVTYFTVQVDDGTAEDVGLSTNARCTAAGDTYGDDLPSLGSAGVHTLTIAACNAVGCTKATALRVVKL